MTAEPPQPAELPQPGRLRTLHGRSTVAWATDLELDDAHWIAYSGAGHPDYNLALCHGPSGGARIEHCIETLTARRRPAILALAAEAAERPDALLAAGWTQVGSAPLMARTLAVGAPATPDATRELDAGELDLARALIARTFGLPPEIAAVALPDGPIAGRTVWVATDPDSTQETPVACAIAVQVEEATVIWSMATDPARRREGHGARVLHAALAAGVAAGSRLALLHASEAGEPFYLMQGFEVVERWEFWSRPRWVLASG